MRLEDLIGKEIQLYPRDTYSKAGILEEVSESGFLIKITRSRTSEYVEGDIVFISHSKGLTFKLVK